MTKSEVNPFHELYVTETVSPEEFVVLFSPFLIKHAQLLFKQGNVVILGSQGSGKSMLLSLLKPEIRGAYYRKGQPFPVPKPLQNFLGAGVGIRRSGAINIGQRPISDKADRDKRVFPLYFADLVNYLVVRDILSSISYIKKNPEPFGNIISFENADRFAKALAKEPCWFNYLDSVSSFEDLERQLDKRIGLYRRYHQFNIDELPKDMSDSKTAIGEPISRTAYCLLESGLLSKGTQLLIRIDELDILYSSDELRQRLGEQYRRIINKALANRDPLVSYKIGSRTYAWKESLLVFGTTGLLEKDRDYKVFNLDKVLRREENPRTWIFPSFAEDVFARRLDYVQFSMTSAGNALRRIFGNGLSPRAAADIYARKSSASKALQIEPTWPQTWKSFLEKTYEENRLSAILAAAWVRQKGGQQENRLDLMPPEKDFPWEKEYWRKERIGQALLQLAGHCGQRLIWCGYKDVLALSGGNILVFVSLCQHIWESFLQSERGKPDGDQADLRRGKIDEEVQAVGIQAASSYWYEKIPERPKGNDRQRFVDCLGRKYLKSLYDDKSMSNPGHNGFSLTKDEMDEQVKGAFIPAIRFINDAVLHADLYEVQHTTKEKSRKQRIKYYLHPIFSPYFKIPESHVKEPIYVNIRTVVKWLHEAEVNLGSPSENGIQLLFDMGKGTLEND